MNDESGRTTIRDRGSLGYARQLGVLSGRRLTFAASVSAARRRTVVVMSQYMAWPTGDGVWHIGTGLTLPLGAGLADLNKLLTRRHIERAQIGFHRPSDEAEFNEQFATAID